MPTTAIVPPAAPRGLTFQGALVGGAVDAQRQPGDDHQPGPAQVAGEGAGVLQPLRGGVAAADDGDRVGAEQLDPAFDIEKRRRVRGFEQRCRIARVAEHQHVATASRRVGRSAFEPGEGCGEQGGELGRLRRQRRRRGVTDQRPARCGRGVEHALAASRTRRAGAAPPRGRPRGCRRGAATRPARRGRSSSGLPRSEGRAEGARVAAEAAAIRAARTGRRARPARSPTGSARTTCARTPGTRTARRGARRAA